MRRIVGIIRLYYLELCMLWKMPGFVDLDKIFVCFFASRLESLPDSLPTLYRTSKTLQSASLPVILKVIWYILLCSQSLVTIICILLSQNVNDGSVE